jgi:DNA-binding FadR family transcriptional regulator
MDVKLRTLPNQVAGVLVRRIVGGEVANGLVPSEQEISLEFGVSRAVVREALKILRGLDMVEIAQGRRVMLRPAAEWDYLSPLLVEWLPPDQIDRLLHELHAARLILEPAIAAQAAWGITDELLARLAGLLQAMAANEHDPDRYLELDLDFHMTICLATRNRIIDRFMYSSRCWQSASRRMTNQLPRALLLATAGHQAIYDALAARDPKRAETTMREHLMRNRLFVAADDASVR